MYILHEEDNLTQQLALKRMNCPNAMIVYKTKQRYLKDLPLRFSDVDILHRNEKSGSIQGLFRTRSFIQDDSHNFVTEDQIFEEISKILEIVRDFYAVFGLLENIKLYLSTRPDDFMGDAESWDKAESSLLQILESSNFLFSIKEKDGAFYGPKIDIHLNDIQGREWQCGTIQLDFQLPVNFKLDYIDKNGDYKVPVVIHRVIYGSIERFFGILLEHYNGNLPFWISPVQVKILCINPKIDSEVYAEYWEYIQRISLKLEKVVLMEPLKWNELRFEAVNREEALSRKIKDASLLKVPVLMIVGEKELKNGKVVIRRKGKEEVVDVEELEQTLLR